jgi:YHS domain-containing protein/mono/diheme cytochrome c family protein
MIKLKVQGGRMLSNSIKILSLAAALVIGVSCKETISPVSGDLQKQIAFGEQVFQAKRCGDCHQTGEMEDEEKAPNLSSVFLAMDTLYVKAHLQFAEVSAMAPIPLTPHEIGTVTQYIASLHAKANTPANLKNADGRCPVCGAPLLTAESIANHLQSSYKNTTYYFECPDCKIVFERDPAWHSQSGYVVKTKKQS